MHASITQIIFRPPVPCWRFELYHRDPRCCHQLDKSGPHKFGDPWRGCLQVVLLVCCLESFGCDMPDSCRIWSGWHTPWRWPLCIAAARKKSRGGGGSLAPEFRCSTKPRCWEVGNACWGLYKLRSNCQPGAFLLAMQMQLSRFVKPYEALIDEIRGLLPPATGIQMACSRECASVS